MADFNFVETDSAEIYTSIIGSLMESCNEPLYPGDQRRIFGEGLVAVLVSVFSLFDDRSKQRTLQYARGSVLDAIGERLGVVRIEPTSASAVFRFTVSEQQAANIVIPVGTRVTTDGSIYFATDEVAILTAGSTYVDITGSCTVGGSQYNGFASGNIATLVDLIPYISGASNITQSSGGDDGEQYTEDGDNKLRERIRLAPAAMSTAGSESAYRYHVLSADSGIVDVAIDCPANEPNTVNLYPLMVGGELPNAEVLAKVLAACSADNVRPITDKVVALSPNAVDYRLEIKYYCTSENEAATIQAVEGTGGAIDQYNEWQTLALGRDINPDKLRLFVLSAGAERVDIVSPSFAQLSKSQVAKLSGAPVITHEVVSL